MTRFIGSFKTEFVEVCTDWWVTKQLEQRILLNGGMATIMEYTQVLKWFNLRLSSTFDLNFVFEGHNMVDEQFGADHFNPL